MICPQCKKPELFESPQYESDYRCLHCHLTFTQQEITEIYGKENAQQPF